MEIFRGFILLKGSRLKPRTSPIYNFFPIASPPTKLIIMHPDSGIIRPPGASNRFFASSTVSRTPSPKNSLDITSETIRSALSVRSSPIEISLDAFAITSTELPKPFNSKISFATEAITGVISHVVIFLFVPLWAAIIANKPEPAPISKTCVSSVIVVSSAFL